MAATFLLSGTDLVVGFTPELRTHRLFSSPDLVNWSLLAPISATSTKPIEFRVPVGAGPKAYFPVVTP